MLGSRRSIHQRIVQIATPRPATRGASIVAIVLILGIACVTLTRGQTRPATSESLIINVFDIRDLIIDHEDFPSPVDTAGWPISSKPATQPAPVLGKTSDPARRQQMVDSVIKQIQAAIDPTGWTPDDPSGPSIREASGQLIIRQTQTNLDSIRKLLDATREEISRQIVVETRFLSGEHLIDAWAPNSPDKWKDRGDGVQVWPEFLSDEQVGALLHVTQTQRETTTLTAPRVTLFNKQRANIITATDMKYIADMNTTPDGGLEPVTKTVSSGIVFDVRCEIRPDKDSVTCAVQPKMSSLRKMEWVPWPAPPAPEVTKIQVPHLVLMQFNKTFDIAADKTLLIRAQPQLSPPDPAAPPEKPLYILIKPRILLQRGEPAGFPVLQP
jgi:hypothetical protein